MFERPPPSLDHGVRELQRREGQHAVQDPGRDQFVDLSVPVLEAKFEQFAMNKGSATGCKRSGVARVSTMVRFGLASSRTCCPRVRETDPCYAEPKAFETEVHQLVAELKTSHVGFRHARMRNSEIRNAINATLHRFWRERQ